MNKEERLNPHFNINAKYEAMIRDSKEIVKHYLSKESDGEPEAGVCLAYDVKNYLPSLLEENKELHNKIDKAIKFIEDDYYSKNTVDIDSVSIPNNKLIQIRDILRGDVDDRQTVRNN